MSSRGKRAGRIVKHQKTRVMQTGKDHSGESSPYWDWQEAHGRKGDDEPREVAQANPDVLPDSSAFQQESGHYSVGDISRQLSGQQKKCFDLYVQEGRSEKDIAKILELGEATVRTHLRRVRERFRHYV